MRTFNGEDDSLLGSTDHVDGENLGGVVSESAQTDESGGHGEADVGEEHLSDRGIRDDARVADKDEVRPVRRRKVVIELFKDAERGQFGSPFETRIRTGGRCTRVGSRDARAAS